MKVSLGTHREPLPENNRKKKKVEHLPKARFWAKPLVPQRIRGWLRGVIKQLLSKVRSIICLFYVYEYVRLCTMCACCLQRSERALETLEVEEWEVVRLHVASGHQT